MSITITINDNHNYCQEHDLGQTETYECQCVDLGEMDRCPICSGSGTETFTHYPYDMNIANGNFSMLWNALGLEFDWCGNIDGRQILDILKTFDNALLCRQTNIERKENGPVIVACGVDVEGATRYISRLREIAEEAVRREQPICWY